MGFNSGSRGTRLSGVASAVSKWGTFVVLDDAPGFFFDLRADVNVTPSENRTMQIRQGKIYVLPPGFELLVTGPGRLTVQSFSQVPHYPTCASLLQLGVRKYHVQNFFSIATHYYY